MKLTFVGAGYVGLVTAVCFAEMGHRVMVLDINHEKIALLQQGKAPFYEPGLEELLSRNLLSGRMLFSTNYDEAIPFATTIFLAVDTPEGAHGESDLSHLFSALEMMAGRLEKSIVLVNKSTCPVGTAKRISSYVERRCRDRGKEIRCTVVVNPEFLKEGDAISDCLKPDRIVIGSDEESAFQLMEKLYGSFTFSRDRILRMDPASAEMAKYSANAMLALRISFMNEISTFCEAKGADIALVRKALGMDERIGPAFLYAGVGFGGHCFPKDLRSFAIQAQKSGGSSHLIEGCLAVNERQKHRFCENIRDYFAKRGGVKGRRVAILGLSFKPKTGDMRRAPSIDIIRTLLQWEVELALYDPLAMEQAKKIFPPSDDLSYALSERAACQDADAIALITEWPQFRSLPFEQLLKEMRGQAFFDGRNQYDPEEMANLGFDYFSIGRKPALKASCAREFVASV